MMKHKLRIWSRSMMVMGLIIVIADGCVKITDIPIDIPKAQVTDVEGNEYKIVTIGSQVWMAENLKTTKFSNGDLIRTTSFDISGDINPLYQWAYGENEENVRTYGRLYTWDVATDSRNVCPTGWHVPADNEWETLKSFMGGDSLAGGRLKETGIVHWQSPNTGNDDAAGFNALPGGYRSFTGEFGTLEICAYLWSSTENPNTSWGWGQQMCSSDGVLLKGGYFKQVGASIRCIHD